MVNETQPWTEQEDDQLIRMFLEHLPMSQMKERLKRTTADIIDRLHYLAFGKPQLSAAEFNQIRHLVLGSYGQLADVSERTNIPLDTLRYVWYRVKRPSIKLFNWDRLRQKLIAQNLTLLTRTTA